jgi:probable blue pigment (indigoidine) exporter
MVLDAEDTLSSMESVSRRAVLITAVAPLAWGTTYLTTEDLLPPGRPLLSAAVRALPAGLVVLLARFRLPSGAWWWRAPLLGACNIGLFFPLLFLGATHLPGGLASALQASSPLVVMAFAYAVLNERAGVVRVTAAVTGLSGVVLLLSAAADHVDAVGLAATTGSVVSSSLGFVLIKKWDPPVDMLTLVGWQLTAGGLLLAPLALLIEGDPPALGVKELSGFVWITVAGTVIAYACWFHGLRHLPAGVVSLVGLVNPAVATLLGVVVAGEEFSAVQALGLTLVLGSVCAGPRTSARIEPMPTCGQPPQRPT